MIISRVVLHDFANALNDLQPESHITVAKYAIEKLAPRAVAFEEQLAIIRENLANVYEEREEWTEAAKVLAGISLESNR